MSSFHLLYSIQLSLTHLLNVVATLNCKITLAKPFQLTVGSLICLFWDILSAEHHEKHFTCRMWTAHPQFCSRFILSLYPPMETAQQFSCSFLLLSCSFFVNLSFSQSFLLTHKSAVLPPTILKQNKTPPIPLLIHFPYHLNSFSKKQMNERTKNFPLQLTSARLLFLPLHWNCSYWCC